MTSNRSSARLRPLLALAVVFVVGIAPLAGQTSEETSANEVQEIRDQLAVVLQELRALRREVQQLSVAMRSAQPTATPNVSIQAVPAVPDLTLSPSMHPRLGDPEAGVAIVEFSDYQCPFCRRFHDQTFGLLKKAYIDTGKVQYFFRDFPLEQLHPEARAAAVVARCAGSQDRYWEMHAALFAAQENLGPAMYTVLATRLGLDLETFASCRENPDIAAGVDRDLSDGRSLGVRGTPNYFVGNVENGKLTNVRRLNGAQSFAAFGEILNQMLAR